MIVSNPSGPAGKDDADEERRPEPGGHRVSDVDDQQRGLRGGRRDPAVEHLRDVRVIHEGQRLTLGLEPGDDLPGVHPRLDELEGDPSPHGVGLLGQVDNAEATLPDLLEELHHGELRAREVGAPRQLLRDATTLRIEVEDRLDDRVDVFFQVGAERGKRRGHLFSMRNIHVPTVPVKDLLARR